MCVFICTYIIVLKVFLQEHFVEIAVMFLQEHLPARSCQAAARYTWAAGQPGAAVPTCAVLPIGPLEPRI